MFQTLEIIALDDRQARLKDASGVEFSLSKNLLPADSKIGDNVFVKVYADKNLADKDPKLAQEILDEVLKTS